MQSGDGAERFERMLRFNRFKELATKHAARCLLSETDQILCLDKPCNYDTASKLSWIGAASETTLLNANEGIQLVEYLALKYDFKTTSGTHFWWQFPTGKKIHTSFKPSDDERVHPVLHRKTAQYVKVLATQIIAARDPVGDHHNHIRGEAVNFVLAQSVDNTAIALLQRTVDSPWTSGRTPGLL